MELGQGGWGDDYQDDVTLLGVGRSWRMGPEPEYMHIWYTPKEGLGRIDFWEETFRSGDADAYEEPFRLAARIDRAGCYDALLEPQRGTSGRYYGEHFDLAPGATREDVVRQYEQRRDAHPDLPLVVVLDRIGKLGPDPRGLAVWGLPSWGHLEEIARELDGDDGPTRLVQASLWADVGQEQL
jgi:hypothetical protein